MNNAQSPYLAHAIVNDLIIEAFIPNRSSLVMPGFRGTPAGITTSSTPLKHSSNWCAPE